MPSKKDPEIVQILQDLQSGKLDPRIKSEDLLRQYPICERYCATKKEKKNFETYWCRLRKEYINQRNLLDPYRTNNRIDYIRYPIKTDRPNSKQKQATPPQRQEQQRLDIAQEIELSVANETEELFDNTQEDSPLVFRAMSLQDKQVGLITLQQSCESGSLMLANRAILWKSRELNQHLQLLIHLPSGVTEHNLNGFITSQGKVLLLKFPKPSLLENALDFENLLVQYYTSKQIQPSVNVEVMVNANREACATKKSAQGNQPVEYETIEFNLPFTCESRFSLVNDIGFVVITAPNSEAYAIIELASIYRTDFGQQDNVPQGFSIGKAHNSPNPFGMSKQQQNFGQFGGGFQSPPSAHFGPFPFAQHQGAFGQQQASFGHQQNTFSSHVNAASAKLSPACNQPAAAAAGLNQPAAAPCIPPPTFQSNLQYVSGRKRSRVTARRANVTPATGSAGASGASSTINNGGLNTNQQQKNSATEQSAASFADMCSTSSSR